MKCPNCGFDNDRSEKYCYNCGQQLIHGRKRRGMIFLLVASFLFILFIGYLIFSNKISNPNGKENQVTNQQVEALKRLSEFSSEEIAFYTQNEIIRYVSMKVEVSGVHTDDPEEIAEEFLVQHADLFQIDDIANQFYITENTYPLGNGAMVHFAQQYKGVMVYEADLIVEVDNQGSVKSIHGGYSPALDLSVQPELSEEETFERLVQKANLKNASLDSNSELIVYDARRLQGQENEETETGMEDEREIRRRKQGIYCGCGERKDIARTFIIYRYGSNSELL